MKFNIFRPNAPTNSQSSNRLSHITINPTDVYIRCKNTKNTNPDRRALIRNGLNTLCLHFVYIIFQRSGYY